MSRNKWFSSSIAFLIMLSRVTYCEESALQIKTESKIDIANISAEETFFLISIFFYFYIQHLNSSKHNGMEKKWKYIVNVFPTYQMWRGAFGDDHATALCHHLGLKSKNQLLFSEKELQRCYQDAKENIDQENKKASKKFVLPIVLGLIKILIVGIIYTIVFHQLADPFIPFQPTLKTSAGETCEPLYSNDLNTHGAFDNGDFDESSGFFCQNNTFGSICNVVCAPGYIQNELWGGTAICALHENFLHWVPTSSNLTDPAGQSMCIPDPLYAIPGMIFSVNGINYFEGYANLKTTNQFIPPVLSSFPNAEEIYFTTQVVGTELESLGPKKDSESHGLVTSLLFRTNNILPSCLRGELPIDRIRQGKHLLLFAVIDPEDMTSWLRFTDIVNLETVMTISNLPPVTSRQWSVVTIVVNMKTSTTFDFSYRVDGYTIKRETVTLNCATFVPSKLFCEPATLDSSVLLGCASLQNQFNGWIAEMSVYDIGIDMSVDDGENLRAVEEVEWFLATRYHIRDKFAPAQPQKPLIKYVPSVKGVQIFNFPQATFWNNSVTKIQKGIETTLNTISWETKPRSVSIEENEEKRIILTKLDPGRHHFRFVVQSSKTSPEIYGLSEKIQIKNI
eukprot:c17657_g1_i2.p1 GENE.c17657_g1_i2~~c17657_g1_i2.p1  ORF type:complete len:630 (+),score=218.43 c17657_g1_i2:29-1891(+)